MLRQSTSGWVTPLKKLSEKNLGPFEVIATPGTHPFPIWLPQQYQSVHPVFHVSQLEPAKPDPFPLCQQPPPPPSIIDGNPEFKVSEILDSKIDQHFHLEDRLHYLLCWLGYKGMDKETLWVSVGDLTHSPYLQRIFHH